MTYDPLAADRALMGLLIEGLRARGRRTKAWRRASRRERRLARPTLDEWLVYMAKKTTAELADIAALLGPMVEMCEIADARAALDGEDYLRAEAGLVEAAA